MPELTFWPRRARDRPESGGETESDRNIAEFLATAKSSTNNTIPQRWSTIPGSRAPGAPSRAPANLPPEQTLLANPVSDPNIKRETGFAPGSSSVFPHLPRKAQIHRVPVPAPTPQYIAEAPGPDIINTDPGVRDRKPILDEPEVYTQLTSGTRLHQDNFTETERPPPDFKELTVQGRTYGFMSHENIFKAHIEVEGDTPTGNRVEHTGLPASANTPVELSANITPLSEPLSPSTGATCGQEPDGVVESTSNVSSHISKCMNPAANGPAQTSEPEQRRSERSHESTSSVLPLQFPDGPNRPLFNNLYPPYSDADGQVEPRDYRAAETIDQQIKYQSSPSNNAQPSSQASAPPSHRSDEKKVSLESSAQYPPLATMMGDFPNQNSRIVGAVSGDSSGRNPLHPEQAFETREASSSRTYLPQTQAPQVTEIRGPMVLKGNIPHLPMPPFHASGLGYDQSNHPKTSSPEAHFNNHQEAIRSPEHKATSPFPSEPARMGAPVENGNPSGQWSMISAAQVHMPGTPIWTQDSRHRPRSTAQPENGRMTQTPYPANARRDAAPPPRESSWNSNAFLDSQMLQNMGTPPGDHVPVSKLKKNQRTPNSASNDSGTGVKNWKVVNKMRNLVSGGGGSTPITYSPEEMTRRCLQFMDQQGIPADPGLDPFSTILVYARAKWSEDEALIRDQAVMISDLTDRKETLKATLEATRRNLQFVTGHRDQLRRDLNSINEELESSQKLLSEFQVSFNKQEEYNEELTTSLQRVQEENIRIYRKWQKNLSEKDKELKTVEGSLQAQISELKRRIASYGEIGFRFVTDDKFQDKMKVTEQIISKLVNYVTRPRLQNLDRDLDPTGFLDRNQRHLGNRIWREFIFGTCWGVLRRGFFGSSLGFGIFGPQGNGFDVLNHIHQVLAVHDTTSNNFVILNNKETNEVRGFLFERIWEDVLSNSPSSENQISANNAKGLSVYFNQHVETVTDDLVSALSRCSGHNLDSRAPAEIRNLVRHVGLMGLEMATQRAHLTLEFRAYGEDVQQGTLFVDETVGEGASGAAWVDLLTEPALTRLGNGRNDFTEYKILRPGTFVALRT